MTTLCRFTLLAISFSLLFLPGNMGDALICLGESGHLVVANDGDGGCHSDAPTSVSAEHGDCIDVAMCVDEGNNLTTRMGSQAQGAWFVTFTVCSWMLRANPPTAPPYRSPDWVATSPLVHRKTVVLLI